MAYVVHVAALSAGFAVVVAYTTSSGLVFAGRQPRGLHPFDAAAAAVLGQSKPFRLELKRLAFLPVTEAWFPEISQPSRGVLGRAPRSLRAALQASLDELLRQPDLIDRLGPLWPRG